MFKVGDLVQTNNNGMGLALRFKKYFIVKEVHQFSLNIGRIPYFDNREQLIASSRFERVDPNNVSKLERLIYGVTNE
jgi:hypothetical protein